MPEADSKAYGFEGQRAESALGAEDDAFERRIVGKHGDDGIAAAGTGRTLGNLGAIGRQRLRPPARVIVDLEGERGRSN